MILTLDEFVAAEVAKHREMPNIGHRNLCTTRSQIQTSESSGKGSKFSLYKITVSNVFTA